MFTIETIPTAFSAIAYEKATFSNVLNPINRTQGWTNRILGKPLRALVRAVTAVAIMVISFVGIFYHLGAVAVEAYKGRSPYAWEHLKAAKTDFLNTINIFNTSFFAWFPNAVLPLLSSASLIQIDYKPLEIPSDNYFKMMIDERKQQIREGMYQLDKWYESVIINREEYVPNETLIHSFNRPVVNEHIQDRVNASITTGSRIINDTIETGWTNNDFWLSRVLSEKEKIANHLILYHIVRTYIGRCEWKK